MQKLQIADKTFESRLFPGTGKFSSVQLMEEALVASGSELVTVALKRVDINNEQDDILVHLVNEAGFKLYHESPRKSGSRQTICLTRMWREQY